MNFTVHNMFTFSRGSYRDFTSPLPACQQMMFRIHIVIHIIARKEFPRVEVLHKVTITVELLSSKAGDVFWHHLFVRVASLYCRLKGSLCSGRT